jgi:hypothetical protein
MQNQQVIEAYLPHTPQESLTDGIGAFRVIGSFEHLDATCPRHTSKARPKFAIVIPKEIFRCLPIWGGFSQLLGHPGIGRRSSNPDMDHPSRLQFYNEERKERPKEEIDHRKRVTGPELVGVRARDRSTTSDLVAGGCELLSDTSGWCAYRHGSPVSEVPHECALHPKADCPSPFA